MGEKVSMKSSGKGVYLFLALLLPICVFLFLRFFGKNEFTVEPLFYKKGPEATCFPISYPYTIPDSVTTRFPMENDSLLLLYFGDRNEESVRQRNRAQQAFATYPIKSVDADNSETSNYRKKCIFLLKEPSDLVLLDRKGTIRGQYVSADREDVDRLITEVTIILKKY
jgi:hypothetical protein